MMFLMFKTSSEIKIVNHSACMLPQKQNWTNPKAVLLTLLMAY